MSEKWIRSHMIGKEEETQRLNIEIIGPIEELKRINRKFSKSTEDLGETREAIVSFFSNQKTSGSFMVLDKEFFKFE